MNEKKFIKRLEQTPQLSSQANINTAVRSSVETLFNRTGANSDGRTSEVRGNKAPVVMRRNEYGLWDERLAESTTDPGDLMDRSRNMSTHRLGQGNTFD